MKTHGALAAGLLCLFAGRSALAGEWHVDREAKGNQVKFTSEVVALTFDGTTDRIDGYIYWEGEQLFEKNNQFAFEVDLNSIDTGIGKRNRDMRAVLDTRKWPKATFKGTLAAYAPDSTGTYHVRARGTFSIHGVDRPIEVPATIAIGAGRAHIAADFTIRLRDYDIEAPRLAAFVKVGEEVAVSVRFAMKDIHAEKGEGP